jgi:uncharacterized protein (DUF2141 family)
MNRNLSLFAVLTCAAMAAAGGASVSAGSDLDIRPYEAPAQCGARSPQIHVTIEGVTPQGILTVELYRPSERDFLKKASRIHRIRVPAEQGPQTVCFDIDGAGTYALAAYQDLDADRDLDQKWNMMPAEPFALSNDQKLEFRMPRFEDAAFRVSERGGVVRMTLQR